MTGLGFAVQGLSIARRGAATWKWPTVRGRVSMSELEEGPPSGRIMPVARYRPTITYSYLVNGREWSAHCVFVGDDAYTSTHVARARVRKYAPGTAVEVRYDPADPSRAVLEPGVSLQTRRLIVGGLLLFCAGAAALLSILI